LSGLFTSVIVQCIYAVLKRVIFAVDEEELAEGEEPLSVVLERQMSYFADEDGLNGLLKHLGDSPWCEVLKFIRDGFNETNPRKPFSLWKNINADFKDLSGGLTNFDPTKRLTAHEALAHRWFSDV
jgi:serine/threonine protein kinase